jgi:hypothetical protein
MIAAAELAYAAQIQPPYATMESTLRIMLDIAAA